MQLHLWTQGLTQLHPASHCLLLPLTREAFWARALSLKQQVSGCLSPWAWALAWPCALPWPCQLVCPSLGLLHRCLCLCTLIIGWLPVCRWHFFVQNDVSWQVLKRNLCDGFSQGLMRPVGLTIKTQYHPMLHPANKGKPLFLTGEFASPCARNALPLGILPAVGFANTITLQRSMLGAFRGLMILETNCPPTEGLREFELSCLALSCHCCCTGVTQTPSLRH